MKSPIKRKLTNDQMTAHNAHKHTPGPWTVSRYGHITARDGESIGIMHPWPGKGSERNANARLIAAAPDRAAAADQMLAALEYALPLVERWCHTQGDARTFHEETVAPIKAAIAKAEPIKPDEAA